MKASTGEVVTINQAVLTSSNEGNRTYNLKLLPSGQIRKIRQLSVGEFEGVQVYLQNLTSLFILSPATILARMGFNGYK